MDTLGAHSPVKLKLLCGVAYIYIAKSYSAIYVKDMALGPPVAQKPPSFAVGFCSGRRLEGHVFHTSRQAKIKTYSKLLCDDTSSVPLYLLKSSGEVLSTLLNLSHYHL